VVLLAHQFFETRISLAQNSYRNSGKYSTTLLEIMNIYPRNHSGNEDISLTAHTYPKLTHRSSSTNFP